MARTAERALRIVEALEAVGASADAYERGNELLAAAERREREERAAWLAKVEAAHAARPWWARLLGLSPRI